MYNHSCQAFSWVVIIWWLVVFGILVHAIHDESSHGKE